MRTKCWLGDNSYQGDDEVEDDDDEECLRLDLLRSRDLDRRERLECWRCFLLLSFLERDLDLERFRSLDRLLLGSLDLERLFRSFRLLGDLPFRSLDFDLFLRLSLDRDLDLLRSLDLDLLRSFDLDLDLFRSLDRDLLRSFDFERDLLLRSCDRDLSDLLRSLGFFGIVTESLKGFCSSSATTLAFFWSGLLKAVDSSSLKFLGSFPLLFQSLSLIS